VTYFLGDEAKNKKIKYNSNSKWPTQKKLNFSTSPKAERFPPKFYGLVFGFVGLIDAKGIYMAQPIWP
jgi:hypothetical protein